MLQAKNVGQALKKRSVFIPIGAQAAGVDTADIPLTRIPCSAEFLGVNIIPQGDDADIDATNTSAWLIEKAAVTLASKTYTNTVVFPNKGVVDSLTTTAIVANRKLAEGDVITLSITNGITAATPACIVEIEYIIADASQFDTQHVAKTAT